MKGLLHRILCFLKMHRFWGPGEFPYTNYQYFDYCVRCKAPRYA